MAEPRCFGLAAPLLLLAACTRPLPTQTSTPAPTASPAPSPSLQPTAAPRPSPALAASPDCLAQPGQLVQVELVHLELPRSLPYRAYLPPCAAERRGRLPVLLLLHGLARSDSQWDELGADELAQAWIADGRAPPFLLVMPWERRGLDFESAIVDYLIPHLQQVYGASSDRTQWAIGGISRGAGWALRIGLKHSAQFGAIGLHSPAVLVPDLFELAGWVAPIPSDARPAIWIDMGERDPLRAELAELTARLDELGVAYQLSRFPGEHTEAYWQEHLGRYLDWYLNGWLPARPESG